MSLPVREPLAPMEALLVDEIPREGGWQYEPKWDGFRCLVFRDGKQVRLQSKAGQPLARYFPELTELFLELGAARFVLDGEIAIPVQGRFSFDALLQRIHPAESRVRKLAREYPANYIAFDLLMDAEAQPLLDLSLRQRRQRLESFACEYFWGSPQVRLSPATTDFAVAREWFGKVGGDLDGIVAKKLESKYCPGERTEMQKIKLLRTADCVVGGFRYATKGENIGSLLLGLYDDRGLLHHVGFCSGLKEQERRSLKPRLEALIAPPGFTGHAPGGLSRWSTKRSMEWQPLRSELVVEVSYDHFTGGRFRHGTRLVRWRPDKQPRQCRLDQVFPAEGGSAELLAA